ncbi:MAG: zf-HC2 domain-containing protein, partial [Acidobacteriota bacterium]
MNCETVLERLDDYLDGALAPGERAELERHLRDCGACRGEAEGLRALLASARALPRALEPGGDLWP